MATAFRAIAAPPLTKVAEMAILHRRYFDAFNDLDQKLRISTPGESAMRRQAWSAVMATASAAMHEAPSDEGDFLLTLGLAATWMNALVDQVDAEGSMYAVGVAIEAAITNGLLFAAARMARGPQAPEVQAIISGLVEEVASYVSPEERAA